MSVFTKARRHPSRLVDGCGLSRLFAHRCDHARGQRVWLGQHRRARHARPRFRGRAWSRLRVLCLPVSAAVVWAQPAVRTGARGGRVDRPRARGAAPTSPFVIACACCCARGVLPRPDSGGLRLSGGGVWCVVGCAAARALSVISAGEMAVSRVASAFIHFRGHTPYPV